jgi:hypothetical protein
VSELDDFVAAAALRLDLPPERVRYALDAMFNEYVPKFRPPWLTYLEREIARRCEQVTVRSHQLDLDGLDLPDLGAIDWGTEDTTTIPGPEVTP